ncbi:alpha/beta hydrolase [uncultured Cytophaga sp.]|uniref:alpha/beta fold hydrolase n=1 Tax=uncultured Cytophaga sp. TaxID=160238 RepID=UPI002629A7EC|nr:alpha/beta hydrolase [uncultured Cytophaga sp.]
MKKIAYTIIVLFLIVLLAILAMRRSDIPLEELKRTYTNEHSKFIKIDGMDVHYQDEGTGIPLVLIHGVGSSLNTWDGWAGQLKNDFRIIRLDLPGFALTGPHPNKDYSIDFYASFMKTFLDTLQIDSCYMAGNSLGGYITWNVAAAYPDFVKRMILLDAAGYPLEDTIPYVFTVAQSSIVPLFNKMTPRFLVAQILNEVYGDDSKVTDEIVDRYYYHALREGNRDAFLSVVKTLDFKDYQKLKTIETPALLMWGEKDKWIDLKQAKRFNKDLPHSELIVYPGVGHIPMEELPIETARDAKRFLLGLSDTL